MRKSPVRSGFAAEGDASPFVSAKTATPIPVGCGLVRDALVQATLDPAVRTIEYIASARVHQTQVDLQAIVVARDDGRYVLDVVAARRINDIEAEGLALIALAELGLTPLVLTAEQIRREPRFSNARLIWRYRLHPVSIGTRMKVLTLLGDEGPMQLGRLLREIRADRDPSPAVLALACSGLVELDLVSQPLGPATIARSSV